MKKSLDFILFVYTWVIQNWFRGLFLFIIFIPKQATAQNYASGTVNFVNNDNVAKLVFKLGTKGSLRIKAGENSVIATATSNGNSVVFDKPLKDASGASWFTGVSFAKAGKTTVTVTFTANDNFQDEIPRTAYAAAYVSECDYENGGTKTFEPSKKLEIKIVDLGVSHYPINVQPKDPNRMGKVNAQMNTLEAGWIEWKVSFAGSIIRRYNNPNHDCPECEDTCNHYQIWREPVKFKIKYKITMPLWKQVDKAGEDAKLAWNKFYDALKAHEDGHKTILKNYYEGEGKTALKNLSHTKFYGEAHPFSAAKKIATKLFLAASNTIDSVHAELQYQYDSTTKHGQNQQAIRGTNIIIPDPKLPCW